MSAPAPLPIGGGVRKFLPAVRLVLQTAWEVSRRRAIWLVLGAVVTAVLVPLSTLLSKLVVDGLGGPRGRTVVVAAAAFAAAHILRSVLAMVDSLLTFDLADHVGRAVERRLMRVVLNAPGIEHLERPDFADRVSVLRVNAQIPMIVLQYVQLLISMPITLIGTVALITSVHPALAFVFLLLFPISYLRMRVAHQGFQAQDEAALEQRRAAYVRDIATRPRTAKEVRVFGLGAVLEELYVASSVRASRVLIRQRIRATFINVGVSLMQSLTVGAAMAVTVWLGAAGRITLGSVVMGVMLSRDVVNTVLGIVAIPVNVATFGEMGQRYVAILDYDPPVKQAPPERRVAAPATIERGIELESVGFTYPGTDVEVLHDLSLSIPAGTTVALVGENGAGKTTLVKLLQRFYDPTSGRIIVDGTDLRDVDVDGWRANSTAVFQDFAFYQFLAREAIGIGDLPAIDDADRIWTAAGHGGADTFLRDLPAGLETQLGLDFDGGVEPSVGQKQRVALSRGSMRLKPAMLVLDEPTASLDARAEHELFERYTELARGDGGDPPVTILVSHRFSTVRMADLIVVLDKGRIVDHGTHEELVARGGLYAELYGLQAEGYR